MLKGARLKAQVSQIWLVIIAAVEFGIMIKITKFCVGQVVYFVMCASLRLGLSGNYLGAFNEWTASPPSTVSLIVLPSMLVNRMGSVRLPE